MAIALILPFSVSSAYAVGTVGPAGPKGATGAAGPKGATGPAGSKGATGATGPIGLTGVKGNTGVAGAPGTKGLTGAMGATGPIGLTGVKGDAGVAGAPGATGLTGAMGATGPIGLTGVKGDAGVGAVSQPCDQSDLTGTWAGTASGLGSYSIESCTLTINGNGVLTSGSCFDIKTRTQYPISSGNATITSQCSTQLNLYYANSAVSVASGSISRGRDTIIGSFTNNFGDFGTFSAVRY